MLTHVLSSLQRMPYFKGRDRLSAMLRKVIGHSVKRVHGELLMDLDPREWTQLELICNGMSEPETIALFDKILEPGDVYIDVGAHVGFHSLQARKLVGKAGRVVAIDPQPYNCDKILTNAALNDFDNILVVVAALGAKDHSVQLRNPHPHDKAKLSLSAEWNDDLSRQHFLVPVRSLDSLIGELQIPRVKLLKIDTESYELEVLRGALATLRITSDVVIELHPHSPHDSLAQISNILADCGFRLFDVHGAPWSLSQPAPENNVWARRS